MRAVPAAHRPFGMQTSNSAPLAMSKPKHRPNQRRTLMSQTRLRLKPSARTSNHDSPWMKLTPQVLINMRAAHKNVQSLLLGILLNQLLTHLHHQEASGRRDVRQGTCSKTMRLLSPAKKRRSTVMVSARSPSAPSSVAQSFPAKPRWPVAAHSPTKDDSLTKDDVILCLEHHLKDLESEDQVWIVVVIQLPTSLTFPHHPQRCLAHAFPNQVTQCIPMPY